MKLPKQAGFGVMDFILAAAVIAIIGLISYRMWDANASNQAVEQVETPESTKPELAEVPHIESKEDLDKAAAALDSIDIEGASEAELIQETNF